MPEPTAAMVETLGSVIDGLKFPSFAWRHLLSAYNTARPSGRSVNSSIKDTIVPRCVLVVCQATTVRPEVHYSRARAMCAWQSAAREALRPYVNRMVSRITEANRNQYNG